MRPAITYGMQAHFQSAVISRVQNYEGHRYQRAPSDRYHLRRVNLRTLDLSTTVVTPAILALRLASRDPAAVARFCAKERGQHRVETPKRCQTDLIGAPSLPSCCMGEGVHGAASSSMGFHEGCRRYRVMYLEIEKKRGHAHTLLHVGQHLPL